MARWAAFLALAALPGCDGSLDWVGLFHPEKHDLNITNYGAVQVRVTMEWNTDGRSPDEDFFLDPGMTRNFHWREFLRLEVHAYRMTDGAEIFKETWDSSEMDRHENINLYP